MPAMTFAGAGTSIAGGKGAANASQNIATAQQQEAQGERAYNIGAATPTPDEINALQNQVTNYNQTAALQSAQLQQQMQLYGAVSPQVMAMLQGQNAPTMQPYLNVQAQQQQQLQSQLARQLGPGWQNTTAGNQAMQNFNLQGSNQAAQIQQQYLGTMMANQLALGASNTGAINANAGTLGNLNNQQIGMGSELQKMMLQASMGSNVSGYAGANNIGDLMRSNMWQNMGGSMMNMGAQRWSQTDQMMMGSGGGGGGGGGGGMGSLMGMMGGGGGGMGAAAAA